MTGGLLVWSRCGRQQCRVIIWPSWPSVQLNTVGGWAALRVEKNSWKVSNPELLARHFSTLIMSGLALFFQVFRSFRSQDGGRVPRPLAELQLCFGALEDVGMKGTFWGFGQHMRQEEAFPHAPTEGLKRAGWNNEKKCASQVCTWTEEDLAHISGGRPHILGTYFLFSFI